MTTTYTQIRAAAAAMGSLAISDAMRDYADCIQAPDPSHPYGGDGPRACGSESCKICDVADAVTDRAVELVHEVGIPPLDAQIAAVAAMKSRTPLGRHLRRVASRAGRRTGRDKNFCVGVLEIRGSGPGWQAVGSVDIHI